MKEGQVYFQLEEPVRNDKVAVGNTSTVVAESRNIDNPRKVIVIRNTSDADNKVITIRLGQGSAIAQTGIVLRRNESFADSSETGYLAHQGTITAICDVADGQLSIMER